jgi:uncharacterized protein YwqG
MYEFVNMDEFVELDKSLEQERKDIIEQFALIDYTKPSSVFEAVRLQGKLAGIELFYDKIEEMKGGETGSELV